MLFKKRWSDGLHNDFEHVDEFESKFGLFGGDGGDDGGGGGDVGSQVDSFSDMPGSVDVASQVDTFSDVPAFSAAPAAAVAAPAVDTFSEIGSFAPVASKGFAPASLSALSTPMGIGSLAPAPQAPQQEELPSYNPYAPLGNRSLSAAYSPSPSYLSSSAIDRALGPISPSGAYQAATAPPSSGVQIGMPEINIGGQRFTVGSVPNQPGAGVVAIDPLGLGGRAGITGNLNNVNVGYALPLKDGGVVSLLRR